MIALKKILDQKSMGVNLMPDFGDTVIAKTFNHIPTDMN